VSARRARVIRAGLAVALLVGAGAFAHAADAPRSPSAAGAPGLEWRPVADGADRATMRMTADGSPEIQLLRFDLERFRAEVVVGKGVPPHPRTAADLRKGRGAVAAVNGGFFDEQVVPLGLRIADGETRFPLRAKADWGVLVLAGHRARIVHTREFPPPPTDAAASRIDGAIQVGPRLVVDGVPLKLRPQLARRTAVALDRGGRLLTLVVAPGPVDASALAVRLAALGFQSAVLLDGGPSTQASVLLGPEKLEVEGAYPVPDLLAIFNRPPPRKVNGPPTAAGPSTTRDAPRP